MKWINECENGSALFRNLSSVIFIRNDGHTQDTAKFQLISWKLRSNSSLHRIWSFRYSHNAFVWLSLNFGEIFHAIYDRFDYSMFTLYSICHPVIFNCIHKCDKNGSLSALELWYLKKRNDNFMWCGCDCDGPSMISAKKDEFWIKIEGFEVRLHNIIIS